MKKFLSLGLALVMSLALMIPALAEEQTFSTENSSLTPTIEVDMPSSAGVILNPYGMTYKGGILGGTTQTQAQIISNVFNITNKTKGCNLEVKAKITGVVAGSANLVALNYAGLEDDTTNPLPVPAVPKKWKTTGTGAEKGNKVCLALTYNFTGTTANAAPTTMGGTWATAHTKIVTESEQELDTIVLPPSDGTKHTYVTYQFSGIAVSKPTEAWTESDSVGASFVYTFTATPDPVTTAS